MTAHLASCTLVALAAVAVTWLLRGQPAAWRHAILFLALLRFLVPTPWLTDAGRALPRVAPGRLPLDRAADEMARLLLTPGANLVAPGAAGRPTGTPHLAIVWASGIAACFGLWAWRARHRIPAVRPATQREIEIFQRAARGHSAELRIVAADAIPGAWGWWRPCVILPDGLSAQLGEAELESVLAHEVAHVGRHDNLVAAIAHAIVSVFWFHPLAWWIEHRMLAERETACDEFVLAGGLRAEDYVAGILKVCRMAFTGAAGYAGVTGSNLENRMEFIMSVNLNRRSSRVMRALLGSFLAVVAGLPVAGGYMSAQQETAAPQRVPSAAETRFQDGVRLLQEKHYEEAAQAFREVQQLDPAGARGLAGQAEVKTAQGQWDEALQLVQAEVDKDPLRVDFRLTLGNVAARAGRYDQAIAAFQGALAHVDKNSKAAGDIYLKIGESYRRKGDTESAIANIRRAAELQPDSAQARVTLALALDAAGKTAGAEQEYRATLERDPKNAVAMNNLAFVLSEKGGDLSEALTLAQRARELQPNLLEIADTEGWIYLKMGRPQDAAAAFDGLVRQQPQNPTYRFHLGMALSASGDRFAATEQFHAALKSGPPQELAQKIRQALQAIE